MTDTISAELRESASTVGDKLLAVKDAVAESIFGQDEVIHYSLCGVLAGGHLLLMGVPGLAKTRLVTTLAKVLGLDAKRVQCTPDLMPSDIIGTEVLEEVDYGRRNFRFIQGPVFCQMLMVDEINRASPRTQSALLQAMEERHVTMSGHEYVLPDPFHVLATQNPLEQEGTYPLPEAQLDRFLLQIDIDYPSMEAERRMLTAPPPSKDQAKSLVYTTELKRMQDLVRRMPLTEPVLNGILTLVRNGRPETSSLDIVKKYVGWGPGPRASLALGLVARARALMDGRAEATMKDVVTILRPVLRHRIALNFAARAEGIQIANVLHAMTQSIAS